MKRTFFVALTLLGISLNSNAMRSDLQKHFGVSYAMAVGADAFCGEVLGVTNDYNRVLCAFGGSFAVGLAKEIYDDRQEGNYFDKKDLTFDFAGALMGAVTPKVVRDWNPSIYKRANTDEIGLSVRYDF